MTPRCIHIPAAMPYDLSTQEEPAAECWFLKPPRERFVCVGSNYMAYKVQWNAGLSVRRSAWSVLYGI